MLIFFQHVLKKIQCCLVKNCMKKKHFFSKSEKLYVIIAKLQNSRNLFNLRNVRRHHMCIYLSGHEIYKNEKRFFDRFSISANNNTKMYVETKYVESFGYFFDRLPFRATVLKIGRTGIYLKPQILYLNFIVKYFLQFYRMLHVQF